MTNFDRGMMRIYSRAELHTRPFTRPRSYVSIASREWVIYHYPGAGTPPRGLEDYRRWMEHIHMDQNGWSTVGYNYFIAANGDVGEGCGRDVVGSHSPPHNRDGIGVNIWTSNGVATPESLHSAVLLHAQLEREAGHSLRRGYHGMDYPTACPGPQLRNWVKAGMPDPLSGTTTTPTGDEFDMADLNDLEKVVRKVIAKYLGDVIPNPKINDDKDPNWDSRNVASYTLSKAHHAHQNAYRANLQSAATLSVVRELAKKGGISAADLAKIEKAAEKGARDAINDKIEGADVTLAIKE